MEIYANPDFLHEAVWKCQELVNEMSSVTDSYNKIISTLDSDIKTKAVINLNLQKVGSYLVESQKYLLAHSTFLNNAREEYFEADKRNQLETEKLKNDLFGGGYRNGIGSVSDFVSDIRSKQTHDKMYASMDNMLFGKYRNVSNLKYLSCAVTVSTAALSFGSKKYLNAVNETVSATYAKTSALMRSSMSELAQKVIRYYPNFKRIVVSTAASIVRSITPYSSSYTTVYKLAVQIYF